MPQSHSGKGRKLETPATYRIRVQGRLDETWLTGWAAWPSPVPRQTEKMRVGSWWPGTQDCPESFAFAVGLFLCLALWSRSCKTSCLFLPFWAFLAVLIRDSKSKNYNNFN